MKNKVQPVGVVIGRFQVPDLHNGQTALLRHVLSKHSDMMVLIGVPPMVGTRRNPMSYQLRADIVRAFVCDAIIEPVQDHESDIAWSEQVDGIIEKAFPGRKAVLYGGRDSFAPHYHGRHPVKIFKSGIPDSGQDLRKSIAQNPSYSTEFRRGIIYAVETQWPRLYMTVDIAVLSPYGLLLGRKHKRDGWCFPGGFVDPTDYSLEYAAKRELYEETKYGIEVADLAYVGSALMDDWRYKGPDRIMTSLFCAKRTFGHTGITKASDDLAEMKWFPIRTPKDRENIMKALKAPHRVLFTMLKKGGQLVQMREPKDLAEVA